MEIEILAVAKDIDNYIYIRHHESYDLHNIVKIGKTTNLGGRDAGFVTSELNRGQFIKVFKITKFINPNFTLEDLEYTIHYKLTKQGKHKYNDGGTEFFDKECTSQIEWILANLNIEFEELKPEEISEILLEYKKQFILAKSSHEQQLKLIPDIIPDTPENENKAIIIPLPHQLEILDKIPTFYEINKIGKLYWACGMGKALLALFIARKLDARTIVIGVPSVYLQGQMVHEVMKIFPSARILCIGGKINKTNQLQEIINTTNQLQIKTFLASHNISTVPSEQIIITTYDSCHLLVTPGLTFDFKIGDEAHHLVASGYLEDISSESYIKFHDIQAYKVLFMTATPKFYIPRLLYNQKTNTLDSDSTLSISEYVNYTMDNELQFGKIIDTKNVKWAIENNKITDYKVFVLYNTITEINMIIRQYKLKVKDMELFVAAFMVLKSIEKHGDLTHILIYTNTTANSDIIIEYIHSLLDSGVTNLSTNTNDNTLYIASLHSNSSGVILDDEVGKFTKARIGIIACVYIFGEGFDLPKLNGVAFAENMISPIRTTQCALRPNRLDKTNPAKIAYVIIPYLDREERGICTNSFKKCFMILDQLRNNDDMLEYRNKITVASLVLEPVVPVEIARQEANNSSITESSITDGNKPEEEDNKNAEDEKDKPDTLYARVILKDNPAELEKIKLRLKYSTRLKNKESPEKDEYEYMKFLNRQLGISSKVEYNDSSRCVAFGHWVPNPDIYFSRSSVWVNWYDYLGVDTSGFIQDKHEWLEYCRLYYITNYKEYYELQKIKKELPLYPEDLYIEFTNIDYELNKINLIRRRR